MIRSIITIIFMMFSLSANADFVEEINERSAFSHELFIESIRVQDIEHLKDNYYYSFIYEVLGKDALIASLLFHEKTLIDQVKDKSFAFNEGAQINNIVFNTSIFLLTVTKFLVLTVIIIIVVKSIKAIIGTAANGSFLYGQSIKGSLISVLVMLLFLTPLNNMFLSSHILLSTIASGVNVADKILFTTTEKNLQTYPEYNLPSPYEKDNYGLQVLNFASCVIESGYAENKSQSFYLPMNLEGEIYTGDIQIDKCHLSVTVERDSKLVDRFGNNDDLKTMNADIGKAQQNAIESAIQKSFDRAIKVAAVLNRESNRVFGVYRESSFDVPVSEINTLNCQIDRTLNHKQEFVDYINQQTKCLSSDVANKLVFTSETKPEISFSQDTMLYGRARACSVSNGEKINFDSVEECVKNACSINTNGEYTGLFECSVASSIYEKQSEMESSQRRGFLYAPMILYSQNVEDTISKAGRQPYNTLSANMTHYDSDEKGTYLQNNQYNSKQGLINISIAINQTTPSPAAAQIMDSYNDIQSSILDKAVAQGYFKENAFNFGKGGEAGLFGVNKYLSCINKPYYHNEYISCSNMITESKIFGNNLLQGLQHYYLYAFTDSLTSSKARKTRQVEQKLIRNLGEHANIKSMVLNSLMFFFTTDFNRNNNDLFTGKKTEYDLALLGITPVIQTLHTNDNFGGIISFFLGLISVIVVITVFIIPVIPVMYLLGLIINWMIHVVVNLVLISIWIVFIPALFSEDNISTKQSLVAGFSMLFRVVIFPSILIVCSVFAWNVLSNIHLLLNTDIVSNLMSSTSTNSISQFIDALLAYVVFSFIMIAVFLLIFGIPEYVMNAVTNVFESNLMFTEEKDRSSKLDEHKGTVQQTITNAKTKRITN